MFGVLGQRQSSGAECAPETPGRESNVKKLRPERHPKAVFSSTTARLELRISKVSKSIAFVKTSALSPGIHVNPQRSLIAQMTRRTKG